MYETWYERFMKNMVTIESLQLLVNANKLTKKQLDTMINDRKNKYGF